ncbi:MAG TPA: AI-2E family transporter [Actinomycetes bacterium]|nr:AI-2E family transporter [Actinomycetes bacterium]
MAADPVLASVQADPSADAPAWVAPLIRSTIWRLIWAVIGVSVLILAVLRARSLISMLVISLFFGIAMLPGVNYFDQRHGWSRGKATALILGGLFLFLAAMIFILIPGLVNAAQRIGGQIPAWIDQINKTFGVRIDHGRPPDQINADLQAGIHKWVQDNATNLLGVAGSTLGLVFQFFTVVTFTCYLAVGGPKLLHIYLSRLPPERQHRAGWAWDNAVVETGGYFYSRLLLLVINATLFFFVMVIVGVPWALSLPLSIFEAFAAEFIPVVGTYLGAAVPAIVTLGLSGVVPALILIVWTVIYQQIENYFLSPRISSKTMELNGGVAFGAALAGGAIGGPMGAFMALPLAALITSFAKHYGRTYPVVYQSAYADRPTQHPQAAKARETPTSPDKAPT